MASIRNHTSRHKHSPTEITAQSATRSNTDTQIPLLTLNKSQFVQQLVQERITAIRIYNESHIEVQKAKDKWILLEKECITCPDLPVSMHPDALREKMSWLVGQTASGQYTLTVTRTERPDDHLRHEERKLIRKYEGDRHQPKTLQKTLEKAVNAEDALACRALFKANPQLNPNISHPTYGTALHWAVASQQASFACFLLDRGADPDATDYRGNTPLSIAVRLEDKDTTLKLIEKGASLDVKDHLFGTVLHKAIMYNSEIALMLLKTAKNLHVLSPHGYTLLDQAMCSENKNEKIIKYLQKRGVKLTVHGIFRASYHGLDRLDEVLATGLDIDTTNPYGMTALAMACTGTPNGDPKTFEQIKHLLDRGADPKKITPEVFEQIPPEVQALLPLV